MIDKFENPFAVSRPEQDMYFTIFEKNKSYKLRIFDIKNAKVKKKHHNSNGGTEYYVFRIQPLENYENEMLYKHRFYSQHFPKQSFIKALWDYKDRNKNIESMFTQTDEEVDIDLVFVKGYKCLKIKELKILD